MQKLFLGLLALLLVAACSTPQATSDKMAEKPTAVTETMKDDFRAMAPKAGPAPEIKIGDFQDFTLDNGLQVVLVENHKLPRVSYQLFIDVPPHLESEYAGTGQMMGQMLRRATSTKTKEQIDEEIDFIGASLSAGGSGAFGATISKYKEQLMGMMAEVVLDARFPEEEFAKVQSEAEAGLQSALGNPGAIASRLRQRVTYGTDHPYGELTTEASLKNVSLDAIKEYYETYFVPNRSYLVMVGDLTRAEAEKLAKESFGAWKKKDVPAPSFEMPKAPQGITVNFVPRAGAVQSNIIFSKPVDVKPGTKKALRGSIVNRILGTGFNGRLNQNIREKNAFSYGAGSSVDADELVGSFSASSDVRNEVTDSAVTEFMTELVKISTAPVTPDELNRAKSQIIGSFGRALESPQQIASFALNTIRYGLDRNYYPSYLQKVASSSADDLLEVSREVMSPENINIIVVGDKAVAERLAKFATSGKVNYYDVNGETMNMDDMAAPTDVTPKQVIMDYTKAIGGKAAIDGITSWSQVMEASIQGQTVVQTMYKEGGNKSSTQTQMMGMTVGDQRYNNGQVLMMQQGKKMATDDEMVARMKKQAVLFATVALIDKVDMISISGTETINGKKAIILDLKTESGEGEAQMYFDQESKLLVRRVKKQGPTTSIVDYSDYREVNGVMIPYEMTITGAMPFPLKFATKEMELNADIDQSLFEIEE
jgi:predicted Zn-dependent peptidase